MLFQALHLLGREIFNWQVKYCNNLPDIPFDPKFIAYPFDTQRFISYNPTGLERNYKYELLTEHDLGVAIDLINPDAYSVNEFDKPAMHPDDEKLLEEEMNTVTNTKRSSQHSIALSWMRRPDYISTEQTRSSFSMCKTLHFKFLMTQVPADNHREGGV